MTKQMTTNDLQQGEHRKPKSVSDLLVEPKMKNQIALALPRHMTAERFARIALTELRKVPKLAQCEPTSFMGAVMQCAQLGIEPGGALGHAYLLPFDVRKKQGNQWVTVRTDCQLILGYRGMIDLARRSGQIVSLSARAVYADDQFNYSYGLEETLEHMPSKSNTPGELIYVYAVARLKDGGYQFEVMSRAQVEAIRSQSKAKDSGPWVTHFEEMARKTVVRRLFKYLPVSIEMQTAITLDERAESGLPQDNQAVITGEYEHVEDSRQPDPEPVEEEAEETHDEVPETTQEKQPEKKTRTAPARNLPGMD